MVEGDSLGGNPSSILFAPRILGNLTAELCDTDNTDNDEGDE